MSLVRYSEQFAEQTRGRIPIYLIMLRTMCIGPQSLDETRFAKAVMEETLPHAPPGELI
jgi:hypothetical protein